MRNSSILKLAKKNNKLVNGTKNAGGGGGGKEEKKWLHAPETLLAGHVVYLVKFLGSTAVDQPKGIDVVKQGIQKLKFDQQIRKSENGEKAAKTPKMELTISVDGVTIQEPKTKKMMHKYPLHKISYCADDKAEKRFFSFIAKEGDTTNHTCFVFVSDKLAEEITLTIGQAFELAYKKFLDTSGKEMETKKQILVLQKRVAILENENGELKKRLKDVANIKGQSDVQQYLHSCGITDLCEVSIPEQLQPSAATTNGNASVTDGCGKGAKVETAAAAAAAVTLTQTATARSKTNNELICLDESDVGGVGNKLDGFSLDDINDDDFNPRANSEDSEEDEEVRPPPQSAPPPQALSPPLPPPALPPRVASNNSQNSSSSNLSSTPTFTKQAADNIFSSNPFGGGGGSGGVDPFGMSAFQSAASGAHKSDKSPFAPSSAAAAVGQNFFDDLDPLRK